MPKETHLYTSEAGVRHSMIEDEDGIRFRAQQALDPILERNKAMALHNDGYTADRSMRRAASIPMGLIYEWQVKEGWNALDAGHDPDVARKLLQKLNSNEYAYLRTAEGRLGLSNGKIR